MSEEVKEDIKNKKVEIEIGDNLGCLLVVAIIAVLIILGKC
jgi:hypothetical protein